RLQLALSARHRGADRRRGGGAQARRSRLADADPGQGIQGRTLRADADARLRRRVRFPACTTTCRGRAAPGKLSPVVAGMDNMQIGMIGLGRMGANIARRLMRSGHGIVAYDQSTAAAAELAGDGAVAAKTIDDLVKQL